VAASDTILSRLLATLQTSFRIFDVVWKRISATAIAARNQADTLFINVRGADPIIDDDLVTKRYLDATGSAGSVEIIEFVLGIATPVDSVTSLVANTVPLWAEIQITAVYSPGTTIQIGKAGGAANLLLDSVDIDPQTTGIYYVNLVGVSWGAGAAAVRAAIAGAPAVGAAIVRVGYTGTPNP